MPQAKDFLAHCAKTATALQKMFAAYFDAQTRTQAPHLQKAMIYALEGGKAVRASLCLASASMFGPLSAGHWQLALAIEAMHSYSLVHDDLPAMDAAPMRRGRASVHKHYDEATAILAGDALQSLAFEWLASADFPALLRIDLLETFAHMAGLHGMAGGQNLDLLGGKTEDELQRIDGLKTAALMMWAVDSGAYCNGANAEQRLALRQYARCLGLAFQLGDDMLDSHATSKDIGKPTGQSLRDSKTSLVTLLGRDAAHKRAHKLIAQAQKALDDLAQPADLLRAAAQFVLERED